MINFRNVCEYRFSSKDFKIKADWEGWNKSNFDEKLESTWNSKESKFRYKLAIDATKILDGEYGFLAQLNINRAVNRRAPEDIRSIKQPFSPDRFNFTKVDPEEIMFSLVNEDLVKNEMEKDYFLINVSPLEKCHCLLVPRLYKCLPQIINEESLYTALHALLLSSSPEFRVAVNSLCAYASVNHLHFHAYYMDRPMKLETISVKHLAGRCYLLENYPSKGYVFQVTVPSDISAVVRDIFLLTSYFIEENIAHNLYFTRGLTFEQSALGKETTERNCIRIYVWARKSSFGAKVLNVFNAAACEFFGHLGIKSKESYDNLDEKSVAEIFHSLTYEPFMYTKEKVKGIFSNGS